MKTLTEVVKGVGYLVLGILTVVGIAAVMVAHILMAIGRGVMFTAKGLTKKDAGK